MEPRELEFAKKFEREYSFKTTERKEYKLPFWCFDSDGKVNKERSEKYKRHINKTRIQQTVEYYFKNGTCPTCKQFVVDIIDKKREHYSQEIVDLCDYIATINFLILCKQNVIGQIRVDTKSDLFRICTKNSMFKFNHALNEQSDKLKNIWEFGEYCSISCKELCENK